MLSTNSLQRLETVHPALAAVVLHAAAVIRHRAFDDDGLLQEAEDAAEKAFAEARDRAEALRAAAAEVLADAADPLTAIDDEYRAELDGAAAAEDLASAELDSARAAYAAAAERLPIGYAEDGVAGDHWRFPFEVMHSWDHGRHEWVEVGSVQVDEGRDGEAVMEPVLRSLAVDIGLLAPGEYSNGVIDWSAPDRHRVVVEAMFEAAAALDVQIRYGGDYSHEGEQLEVRDWTSPHFELALPA